MGNQQTVEVQATLVNPSEDDVKIVEAELVEEDNFNSLNSFFEKQNKKEEMKKKENERLKKLEEIKEQKREERMVKRMEKLKKKCH